MERSASSIEAGVSRGSMSHRRTGGWRSSGREPRRRRRGAAEPNCRPRGCGGADGHWVPRREGGSAGPRSATAAAGGAGGGAAAVARSGSARAEGERTRRGEGGGACRADAVANDGEERNARSAGRSGHAAGAAAMLLRDDEEVARSAAAGWKPCNAGPGRRLAARPSEQGAALGGSRGVGRLRQRQRRMRPTSCAAAVAREGVGGRAAWRSVRGEGETCSRDAVSLRRCT